MSAGRRALHKCPPHCCDLIGGELPGAELKLVSLHVGLQFTAIFCTNSSSSGNMASFFEKHLIYPSNGVPKSMADLRRYEGFFPNMSGATYDPISLMNEEKNREPSGSFSSDSNTASHDDDIFSNPAFAFSRYLLSSLSHGNYAVRTAEIAPSLLCNQPCSEENMCISAPKYKFATCNCSPKFLELFLA